MQIVANDQLRQRAGSRWATIAHFASMGLLVVGFVLSLLWLTDLRIRWRSSCAYVAMIGALLLLNFGRTFTRRFGHRVPAGPMAGAGPSQGWTTGYTLFNYASPDLPDHVLLGPTGLYVLLPKPNGGTVRFDGRRWSTGQRCRRAAADLAEGESG